MRLAIAARVARIYQPLSITELAIKWRMQGNPSRFILWTMNFAGMPGLNTRFDNNLWNNFDSQCCFPALRLAGWFGAVSPILI